MHTSLNPESKNVFRRFASVSGRTSGMKLVSYPPTLRVLAETRSELSRKGLVGTVWNRPVPELRAYIDWRHESATIMSRRTMLFGTVMFWPLFWISAVMQHLVYLSDPRAAAVRGALQNAASSLTEPGTIGSGSVVSAKL